MQEIPVQEKYLLTIHEASKYFGIGIKSMRRFAEDHTDSFAIRYGNRYMIIRTKCEEYLLGCLEKKSCGVEVMDEPDYSKVVEEVEKKEEEKGKEANDKRKEANDKATNKKGKKNKRQKREE